MNQLETLLDKAKKEAKRISQESYSEGFRDAEGALTIMQRMFNDVQNVLLKALGRKRRATEITLDTANEVAEKLKPKTQSWSWDWSYSSPPALFGGSNAYTPKPLVFSEDINTPCTAEVEVLRQKIDRLKAYLLSHARENNKRAEWKEENANLTTGHYRNELMRSSYFLSGKGEAYANAHKKVMEILG